MRLIKLLDAGDFVVGEFDGDGGDGTRRPHVDVHWA
jgi:hypothetical protein